MIGCYDLGANKNAFWRGCVTNLLTLADYTCNQTPNKGEFKV
jgi:hypothetical protein